MGELLKGVLAPPLGSRPHTRQDQGVTMVMDKGIGLRQTYDLVDLAAPYIDYWKLPFGSALLYPEERLRDKVRVLRQSGLVVYPGGTALEIAVHQGRLDAFFTWVARMGMDGVEVSDGTLPMSPETRIEAIVRAKGRGFHVLTEVGKKAHGSRFDPAEFWRAVALDREAGAEQVIVEGREAGRGVGIYDDDGAIDPDELDRLVAGSDDPARLLWEAPEKEQQMSIIARFGGNVGLGNVPPGEILSLECLRLGLRADTFRLVLDAETEAGSAREAAV